MHQPYIRPGNKRAKRQTRANKQQSITREKVMKFVWVLKYVASLDS